MPDIHVKQNKTGFCCRRCLCFAKEMNVKSHDGSETLLQTRKQPAPVSRLLPAEPWPLSLDRNPSSGRTLVIVGSQEGSQVKYRTPDTM